MSLPRTKETEEESPREYVSDTVQVRMEFNTLRRSKTLNHALVLNVQSIKYAKTQNEMRELIKLPPETGENEWLFCNLNQLFDQTIASYQQCHLFCTNESCKEMTAGEKYKFLWADKANQKPINLSAPDYIYKLFEWIDDELSSLSDVNTLPKSFKNKVSVIMRRLLRVYAHIYYCHSDKVNCYGLNKELNNTFHHLVFFILEFKLCSKQHLEPIQKFIEKIERN